MLAHALAALVALSPAAAEPRGSGPELRAENSARARRGLLPRKLRRVRPAGRTRRIVLLPPAPTWLGDPVPVVDPFLAPAASGAPPGERTGEGAVRAAVGGARVGLVILRRPPAAHAPGLRAALAGPEVEAVLVRRARRATR